MTPGRKRSNALRVNRVEHLQIATHGHQSSIHAVRWPCIESAWDVTYFASAAYGRQPGHRFTSATTRGFTPGAGILQWSYAPHVGLCILQCECQADPSSAGSDRHHAGWTLHTRIFRRLFSGFQTICVDNVLLGAR
jgi:hypothetical protein